MEAQRVSAASMIIAALSATLGCGGDVGVSAEPPARPVKMVTFGEASEDRSFTYPGKVHPDTAVEVAFEVSGRLEELPVAKGQEVAAGSLLGRLDPRDFENEVSAARAALEEAVATLGRFEEAAKSNAVAKRDLDEARARARIARAELEIRKKALEDTIIRAKFDGVVADRYVENFQNVEAKQPVLSLHYVSVLEVRVDVPERDMAAAPGTEDIGTFFASFAALPGRRFELELKEFVTTADPVTQTFPVTLRMPNPPGSDILPGMTASVTWNLPRSAGAAQRTLPVVSVLGQPGREPWVWVVDGDSMRVSRRPVTVGSLTQRDQIQVLGGLEAGERVASAGAHHLSEGMKVREYAP